MEKKEKEMEREDGKEGGKQEEEEEEDGSDEDDGWLTQILSCNEQDLARVQEVRGKGEEEGERGEREEEGRKGEVRKVVVGMVMLAAAAAVGVRVGAVRGVAG